MSEPHAYLKKYHEVRRHTHIRVWLVYILICLGFTGCIKNEFKVTAQLPETVNSSYRVVYYAHDKRGGLTQETAITITAGRGLLKGITRLPVCVMIFEGSSRSPAAIFYAQRGDHIRIKGDDASPYSWDITGNTLTDQLTAWRLENRTTLMSGYSKAINKIVADYVRANPDNVLAPMLLSIYFDRREAVSDGKGGAKTETMESLIAMLKGGAAEEAAIWITDRMDMMTPAEARRKIALSNPVILQTSNNGADTVVLNQNKPTLLLFRSYGTRDQQVLLDTLKSLLNTYKDSTRRNVVELYMAHDSLNWSSAISHDTLRGIVRARLPREEAEPIAVEAGVTRTPWWIVIDGKGNIRYSGQSAERASHTFRPLISNKNKVQK